MPEAVTRIQEQLTIIQHDNETIHTNLIAMDNKVQVLLAENISLRAEVEQLRAVQQENLQYQRSNNMIISNIPAEPNEDESKMTDSLKLFLENLM